MQTFVVTTLIFLVITVAINVPVTVFAHRRGRRRTIVRFFVAALVIAVICGFLEASADRLPIPSLLACSAARRLGAAGL
mgnify:CR=1 FL=1